MKKILSLALLFCKLSYAYQSEQGQDKVIHKRFFNNQRTGFFVDVGAHDGKTHSNTYFFEKALKWKGVCIEPTPHLFRKLKKCRSALCLNVACSDKEGKAKFLASPIGFINALEDNVSDGSRKIYFSEKNRFSILTVPCYKLSTLFQKYKIKYVDYLSIDAEGSDVKILHSIDFSQVRIGVISIEAYPNEVNAFLAPHGFTCAGKVGNDSIFVHKDYLKKREAQ